MILMCGTINELHVCSQGVDELYLQGVRTVSDSEWLLDITKTITVHSKTMGGSTFLELSQATCIMFFI